MSGYQLPVSTKEADVAAVSQILGDAKLYHRVELSCMLCGRPAGSFLSVTPITSIPYRQCRKCGGTIMPDEYSVIPVRSPELDIAYYDGPGPGPHRGRPSLAMLEERKRIKRELFRDEG